MKLSKLSRSIPEIHLHVAWTLRKRNNLFFSFNDSDLKVAILLFVVVAVVVMYVCCCCRRRSCVRFCFVFLTQSTDCTETYVDMVTKNSGGGGGGGWWGLGVAIQGFVSCEQDTSY